MTVRARSVLFLAAVALAMALAMTVPSGPVWSVTYALGVLCLYEVVHVCCARRSVLAIRSISARMHGGCHRIVAGETLEVVTELHLTWWSSLCFVRWRHRVSPNSVGTGDWVRGVRAPGIGLRARIVQRLLATERGRYEFGPVEWTVCDVLGIQPLSGATSGRDAVLIHPPCRPIVGWSLSSFVTSAWRAGPHGMATAEAHGLREYHPGDAPAQIHWGITAHRDRLMVRERAVATWRSVLLALDTDAANYASQELFEWTVVVYASLMQHVVERGVPMALDIRGVGRFAADHGASRFDVMREGLDALADVQTTSAREDGWLADVAGYSVVLVCPILPTSVAGHGSFGTAALECVLPALTRTEPTPAATVAATGGRRIPFYLAVQPVHSGEPIRMLDCRGWR